MADQSERDPFPPERQGNPNVKLLLGAIAVAYIALVAFMWNRESPIAVVETEWTGKPAPDFTVATVSGETVQLSQLKGKRVVVAIWATWCGPCVREAPHFQRLWDEHSNDVIVLGISNEPQETVKAFVDSRQFTYPIASADVPAPFGNVEAYPTTFFLDREGKIESVIVGYHDFAAIKRLALGG